jgi:CheY-like chemotaxis protein
VTKADDSQGWFFVVDRDHIIKEIIEASGIGVRCFSRATECFAQWRERRCDVLIASLQMPQKNGLELREQAREWTLCPGTGRVSPRKEIGGVILGDFFAGSATY